MYNELHIGIGMVGYIVYIVSLERELKILNVQRAHINENQD